METTAMTDGQIAQRMVDYIAEAEVLWEAVSAYMNDKTTSIDKNELLGRYKVLKESVREDAHTLGLSRHSDFAKESRIKNLFHLSIREAAAEGFRAPTNSAIDRRLWDALSEALYKMKKHCSFDDWKRASSDA